MVILIYEHAQNRKRLILLNLPFAENKMFSSSISLKYCCPILAQVSVICRKLFWETCFHSL